MGKQRIKRSGRKHEQSGDDPIIKATSDLFIATLFSAPKNEPILRGVINAVLENCGHIPIKTATVLNPFNVKEFAVDKEIVLDVRVTDERDRIFNVEIQTSPHPAFVERIMFGWADTFSGQLHAGHQYHKLKPVFCIVITEFKVRSDLDSVHLIFELRERNRPEIVLSGHLQMHFLQLYELLKGRREALQSVSPNLRHWLNFLAFGGLKEDKEMSQLVENDPLVMTAVSELRHFASDPNMQELERRRKLWRLEYYSGLEAAKEEGREKGREEGREEGVIIGVGKRNTEIARNMKEDGVDPNVIAKYTGLSSNEIARLDGAPVQRESARTKSRSRKPA